jgi:tRNA(Arg) A34 adenosine deaminase TadA
MCNSLNKKIPDKATKAIEDQESNISRTDIHKKFMKEAVDLAIAGMKKNEGGPFGCIIVKDGKIIGKGNNKVTSTNDPTAHAEITAIRDACKNLNSFQLDDCTLYTSCEPCPMCLGAIYWARPKKVFFGSNKKDAAEVGFDDDFIYKEIDLDLAHRSIPFEQINREDALKAFKIWDEKENKTAY